MSLMKEYIGRNLGAKELEDELLRLIAKYNKVADSFLFVYNSAIGKKVDGTPLEQEDFFIIADMLKQQKQKQIDVYLETPGGSGEAAEEIARFFHAHFEYVRFFVVGEAKSAGTLLVLSGNEIFMGETGSLGPIDAQVRIGRSVCSAHDYMDWVDKRRQEAANVGALNPFDAMMVAQITPGELGGVFNALKFAEDLVEEWLATYKFENWDVTEERKIERAKEIANKLVDHGHWRTHGRSLKKQDLEAIGLRIASLDDDPKIADIIYRIQTVCRLLFGSTTVFKIFASENNKIVKLAAGAQVGAQKPAPQQLACQQFDANCPQCGKSHHLYLKFVNDKSLDDLMRNMQREKFPKDGKLTCECGFQIDLSGIRNDIEVKSGLKSVLD